ncbi:hypothetical protein T492DRAFT_844787 [Pavlovales sp. CCMP2436]|nr:hypothetical protein T492DRAFT_844787 [Pavlovales sp. CCMP2436]
MSAPGLRVFNIDIVVVLRERRLGLYTAAAFFGVYLLLMLIGVYKDLSLLRNPTVPAWKRLIDEGSPLVSLAVRVLAASSIFAWYLRVPGEIDTVKQRVTR